MEYREGFNINHPENDFDKTISSVIKDLNETLGASLKINFNTNKMDNNELGQAIINSVMGFCWFNLLKISASLNEKGIQVFKISLLDHINKYMDQIDDVVKYASELRNKEEK